MSEVYVVCPVTVDPDYERKRTTLNAFAQDLGVMLKFPLDSPQRPGVSETLNSLRNCDAVIADLSLERPSCYFELGIAKAFGKPVFAMCHTESSIHQGFDVANLEHFDSMEDFDVAARRIMAQVAKISQNSKA